MNWLQKIIYQHKELESPDSFWLWSALVSISAVVKDQVYLDKYAYKLYPNIYVMLYADSGLKKGPAISMARKLVGNVNNTKIFSGRFSIQGLLKELGNGETKPGGIILGSSGFICLSELTGSIVNDPFALDILTDLYDRHYRSEIWDSILKQERFELREPILSMISGTNEAHGTNFFANKDIQGGFLARTFLIHSNGENKVNSLMYPPAEPIDYNELSKYLKELSKIRGKFEIADRDYFDSWYRSYKKQIKEIDTSDKTGALNRFDDSVLKVAMLYSLADGPELIITRNHMEQAIEECQKIIGNLRRATLGKGKDVFTQEKSILIQELLDRSGHMITRTALNQKYWMNASAQDWDNICASLESAGIISIENMGNQIIYQMSGSMVDKFRKHFEGR